MLSKQNYPRKEEPDRSNFHSIHTYFSNPQQFHQVILQIDSYLCLRVYHCFSPGKVLVRGIFMLSNGYLLTIPPFYHDLLFVNCNPKDERNLFQWRVDGGGSLIFQAAVDPLNISERKIVQQIKKSILCVKKGLQLLGYLKKRSNYSTSLKKKQLQLKKKSLTLLNTLTKKVLTIPQKNQQNSLIQHVQSLKQILDGEEQNQIRKGGYFQIQRKTFAIKTHHEEMYKKLGVKKIRQKRLNQCDHQNKLEKQWRVIKQLKNPQYFLKYYIDREQKKNLMIMDYVQDTFQMIFERKISIDKLTNLFLQVTQGVSVLHQLGIIHRDIKPCNLLVSQNRGKYEIKIIDFGESTTIDQTYREEEAKILGSTLPYSPIECSVPCEEGFNKKEIDLWSIGVLFYEALLGRKPITYSRCFQQDIYKGWKRSGQFNIFPNIRKKGGIRSVSQVIIWLCMRTIQIQQEKRLDISIIKKVLKEGEIFLHDFLKK